MCGFAELHCHSNYSFQEGASFVEELVLRVRDLGYPALALTDHDNLCGAMEFAKAAKAWGIKPIIGAEVTLEGGYHITLIVETRKGYNNLCRLLSHVHVDNPRREPVLAYDLLTQWSEGLICLSGCRQGQIPRLLSARRYDEARGVAMQLRDWFGPRNFFLELQNNLVRGDARRNASLLNLARDLGIPVVATNNVHYHVRERHKLQDALVAIRNCKTLEETHRERRPNSEFYLKSAEEMAGLFHDCPEALANTLHIAQRCEFDLTHDLNYQFPDYPVPSGHTPDSYLRELCSSAAERRYGEITAKVRDRLEEELRLIGKHGLAGFFLIYHEILTLAKEVSVRLGLSYPETPIEEDPPGRGRGSSVALLVGYLIGLSHIDPVQYDLTLERFLHEDLSNVPDIDLDFARNIREELILAVHEKWGWDHAALTGMISTYQIKGAIRDLGKALGLPIEEVDKLAKRVEGRSAKSLADEMRELPDFKDTVSAPVWRDLVELAEQIDGFPKYLAQHPGGMVISTTPLTELVPVQKGAVDGRYIMQWDKDSIDDARFVKIDFLALGALSQLQDCVCLVQERYDHKIDLSRIDYNDAAVYDMLGEVDTIGIFQVESQAQAQVIGRHKPKDLVQLAIQTALVRPGAGASHGTAIYVKRYLGKEAVTYDHPLEERALKRTLGAVIFQDQLIQLAVDVAGFKSDEADDMRRAFSRRNGGAAIEVNKERFIKGALERGVSLQAAEKIFAKFNGEYMFPESHAYAFGVTAYQAAWLKKYYPLEFYVGIFNQQPMGFYNLETLKEDACRHGIRFLNPDVNRSVEKCTIEDDSIRLGFLNVLSVGEASAKRIVEERNQRGPYLSLADFMNRTGLLRETVENLIDTGVFDCFNQDRRALQWELGLRHRPVNSQMPMPLPVEQDAVKLAALSSWETMEGEYRTMGLYPSGHVMAMLRPSLKGITANKDLDGLREGQEVETAGMVIRRQHPATAKGVVFITLEDEFGLIPLLVRPEVYKKYRTQLKEAMVKVKGTMSRRDGTMNIVVSHAEPLRGTAKTPRARNWG